MRYFYKKPDIYCAESGKRYMCDHPVYTVCTLYKKKDLGLAVVQQRWNAHMKRTWWGCIDPWLVDDIYHNPGFNAFFEKHALPEENGLYPTVTVRKIMWALRMKPLKKERWETVFDRQEI